MKNIHFFLLNALLFVLSAQMVVYQVGALVLGLAVILVTVVEVPEIDAIKKESVAILLPMIVAVFGITLGLFINFYQNWYLMMNYCYCFLVAVISYLVGIALLVFWRTVLGPIVRGFFYKIAF